MLADTKDEAPNISESKPRYNKEQFLASKQFTTAQKDVLAAVLHDGQTYTFEEAKKRADEFLRKEAK